MWKTHCFWFFVVCCLVILYAEGRTRKADVRQTRTPKKRRRGDSRRPRTTPKIKVKRQLKAKRGENKRVSRKRRKSPRQHRDVQLEDLFRDFNFDKAWNSVLKSKSSHERVFKIFFQQKKICSDLSRKHMNCVPAKEKKQIELDGQVLEVDFQVAFGIFGLASVIAPEKRAKLLVRCDALDGYQVQNCDKRAIGDKEVGKLFLGFKLPAPFIVWKGHHDLSLFVFHDPRDAKIAYHPFPEVLDISAYPASNVNNYVLFEFFKNAVRFSGLQKYVLANNFPQHLVSDLMFRLAYIANLWYLILLNNGFEHQDFHQSNVMFDYTRMINVLEPVKLSEIGLNHFYVIDLDTMVYPGCDENAIENAAEDRNQGTVPDSVHIIGLYEDGLENDPAYLDYIDDCAREFCTTGDGPCERKFQAESALQVCTCVLDKEHALGSVQTRLVGLPSCDDALAFFATKGKQGTPPPRLLSR